MPRPFTLTFSTMGRSVTKLRRVVLFITPGPTMPTQRQSSRASLRTASAGTAAVRYDETRLADMRHSGAPVSGSFSMSVRMERGSPLTRFSALEPYHLQPAMWYRPPR